MCWVSICFLPVFSANSALSAALTFLSSSPLHSYHFIISNRSTYGGQKPLFMKSFHWPEQPRDTAVLYVPVVCMTLIICVRSFERVRVYLHVYVYSAAPRLHVTTHKFKRRQEDERRREKGGIILFFFFFKAAHYPAVSGCMAPSQNIMMRINSPGTTSFCWRPSQGSASVLPPQTLSLFFSFPLFSLHH